MSFVEVKDYGSRSASNSESPGSIPGTSAINHIPAIWPGQDWRELVHLAKVEIDVITDNGELAPKPLRLKTLQDIAAQQPWPRK